MMAEQEKGAAAYQHSNGEHCKGRPPSDITLSVQRSAVWIVIAKIDPVLLEQIVKCLDLHCSYTSKRALATHWARLTRGDPNVNAICVEQVTAWQLAQRLATIGNGSNLAHTYRTFLRGVCQAVF